jgi:hypothetical protein
MRKLVVLIIGFFIIMIIYLMTVKKEEVQNKQKQIKIEQQKLQEQKEKELKTKGEQRKRQLKKELNNINIEIENAYEDKNIEKLKNLRLTLEQLKIDDKYKFIYNEIDNSLNKISENIKNIKLQFQQARKRQIKKELNNINIEIENAYEDKDIEKLKNLRLTLEQAKTDDKYKLFYNEIDNLIKKINDNIYTIKEHKQECFNKYSELIQKYPTKLLYFSSEEKNEIKSIKAEAIKLKSQDCGRYIELDSLIKKCSDDL